MGTTLAWASRGGGIRRALFALTGASPVIPHVQLALWFISCMHRTRCFARVLELSAREVLWSVVDISFLVRLLSLVPDGADDEIFLIVPMRQRSGPFPHGQHDSSGDQN
jgi:hypothetical protein